MNKTASKPPTGHRLDLCGQLCRQHSATTSRLGLLRASSAVYHSTSISITARVRNYA